MDTERRAKMILVARKDLNMRKGKLVAQCAHASMKVLLDLGFQVTPGQLTVDLGSPDGPLYQWVNGLFTKVVVSVDSEEELLGVYNTAKAAGILCSLIEDAGLTEFHGIPTKTCAAIGPEWPDVLQPITGHLKLL